MLPPPVSSAHSFRRKFEDNGLRHYNGRPSLLGPWHTRLRQRANITNLGLFILFSLLFLSFFANISRWTEAKTNYAIRDCATVEQTFLGQPVSRETLPRPANFVNLDHLIIVPGHGVWLGNRAEEVSNESYWHLEAYHVNNHEMRLRSRVDTLVKHIQKGIHIASEDQRSLLVFSGWVSQNHELRGAYTKLHNVFTTMKRRDE